MTTPFAAFLASLAMLFPANRPLAVADGVPLQPTRLIRAPATPIDPLAMEAGWQAPLLFSPQVAHQVRIEQHIIIRVSPRSPAMADIVRQIESRQTSYHWEERKTHGCIDMGSLVGVRISEGDRLILYARDRSMFSARLEGQCNARDFYAGFYVEPSKDGKLCVKRDRLQSRSGTSCELSRISRLVAVAD